MSRYKDVRNNVTSLQGINSELEKIAETQEGHLSRKGDSPNHMETDLDMNGQRVYNLPEPQSEHEPMTFRRGKTILDEAQTAATEASNSADEASDSRDQAQGFASDAEESASRVDLGELDEAVEQSQQSAASALSYQQGAANSYLLAGGKASEAEEAADRAEAAADAAFVNADVYPDIEAGLTAVADGEQFQVVEGDEIVRYRRDSASSSTEVARYPASTMVRRSSMEITRGIQVANQSPNLLSADLVNAREMPSSTGSITEPISVGGINSILVKSSPEGTTGIARAFWSIPASAFASGLISASVLLVSANSGTSGGVRVIQRGSGGGQVASTNIAANLRSAIAEPTIFSIAGVPLDPSAERVDLDIDLADSENPGQREFVAQFPMLADGSVSSFRHPMAPPLLPDGDDALVQASNVLRYEYALPLDIPVLLPDTGSMSVTSAISSQSSAVSLDISSDIGGDRISAAELGPGLRGGEVLRLVFTVGESINAALGLLFGDTASARGLAIRENGQVLILNAPSQITNVASGQGGTFSQGDRIVVDARVYGGSAGNYTVRYFVEYPDGTRNGPYDVSGIESLERAWFGVRAEVAANNVALFRFKAPRYSDEWGGSGSGSGSKTVYVDQTGSDDGTGSQLSPFKTINRALAEVSNGGGSIELGGGDYRETVILSSSDNVWIRSRKGERANILGSDQLEVTKTAGYTQVYQAPLASKPVGMGGTRGKPVIFEWGTPSKPISAEERHPLHRGKSHRLPYTEMFEADALEDLDSNLGMWWWGSGVIYLSATDGGDASLKRYEARARPCLGQSAGSLRLSRIHLMFSSSYGANFNGDSAITEDVVVFGSYHNGFYHQSGVWKSYRDESGGNGNDGFNGTVSNLVNEYDDSGDRITAFFYDPYGHDNGDDGISYHYRSDATTYGGLFEHNTKADVVHVTGAAVTCYDTVARGSRHGFYSSTVPTNDASREVTSIRCVDTKAIDNAYSYHVTSGTLECDNAVAINPSIFGYIQSSDGALVARNSKYTGDPAKMKSGNVEVINDDPLV